MGVYEIIGVLLYILSVYLATKVNVYTWVTSILAQCIFFVLFFNSGLYLSAILQIYFTYLCVIGWGNWKDKNKYDISYLDKYKRFLNIGYIIGFTILLGFLINIDYISSLLTPDPYPFTDAFVLVSSIISVKLLTMKKIDNWFLWMIINIVSAILYYKSELYYIFIQEILLIGLNIVGYLNWIKEYKNKQIVSDII